MIEAIQIAAVDPLSTGTLPPVAQPQASALEVRKFTEAMEAAAAGPSGASGASQAGASQPLEGTRLVLTALERLNGSAENVGAMSQAMSANPAELTPGEMMQMTMRCHQFLFTSELTANVANRTSDGISQLFRQQS